MRDSCGKCESEGDPAGAKAPRRLPGPPAESECLEWKINGSSFTHPQKKCRQKKVYFTVKTKLIGAGVRDSCGKCESKGNPAGAKAPRGSRNARGKRVPGVDINGSSFTNKITSGNKEVYLSIQTKLIGTEGTRLLREMRVQGKPRRRKSAEEAHGPPAESECLEWKSTVQVLQTKKLQPNSFFLEYISSQSGSSDWSNPKP